jgi:hypothetical protein
VKTAMPTRIIDVLRNGGYLHAEMYGFLNRMRKLRDMAIHGQQGAGVVVTADQAREFSRSRAASSSGLKSCKKLRLIARYWTGSTLNHRGWAHPPCTFASAEQLQPVFDACKWARGALGSEPPLLRFSV